MNSFRVGDRLKIELTLRAIATLRYFAADRLSAIAFISSREYDGVAEI